MYLIKKDKINNYKAADSIKALIDKINYCNICYNICEENICSICNSEKRNKETICVIRDFRDLISIENTKEFNGLYHILGGLISPMEGINPSDLNIESLLDCVKQNNTKEETAFGTTMDGETTNSFIYKKLIDLNIKITTISRGVSIGDDLEYTDEITCRSLINRQPFEYTLKS